MLQIIIGAVFLVVLFWVNINHYVKAETYFGVSDHSGLAENEKLDGMEIDQHKLAMTTCSAESSNFAFLVKSNQMV